MGSIWLLVYFGLAGVAVLQAVLLSIQAWEHRRYGRSCLRTMGDYNTTGHAVVFAPCRGRDVGLVDNLRALLCQDYADYEVTFVVDSPEDPACPVIERVMAEHPHAAARLLVAGRATDCGQKVHNLLVATEKLPPETRYLVFIDSDARARPEWLRMAVARLDQPGLGATTGYRWFAPRRPSLVNLLLMSINAGVMALFGMKSHYLVWGGSWAIRRDVFERIGLREAWQGALSDDLVASRQLRKARLPVRFEPCCVVLSPLDQSPADGLRFIRRQYMMGRHYAPLWWCFALANTTITNAAWIGSTAILAAGLIWPGLPTTLAATVLGAMVALGVYRVGLMYDLARTYFPDCRSRLWHQQWAVCWSGLAAWLVHWLAILASTFGRRVIWRGVHYRLFRSGHVAVERSRLEA